MTDLEMQALGALVAVQAAEMSGHVAKYGELQYDPITPERLALRNELEIRGVISC